MHYSLQIGHIGLEQKPTHRYTKNDEISSTLGASMYTINQ